MNCGIGGLSGLDGPKKYYAPGAPRPAMKRTPSSKDEYEPPVPEAIHVPTTNVNRPWYRRVGWVPPGQSIEQYS